MTLKELRALAEPVADGCMRFPEPFRMMSVSLEEGDFLHALVRMLRPRLVLELGTGLGVSAKFIAGALEKRARLVTVEPDPDLRGRARGLLGNDALVVDSADALVGETPDLVFIDSGYARRAADIAHWLADMPPGPFVVVHDAARGYEELGAGVGVLLPSLDGMWIGRAG